MTCIIGVLAHRQAFQVSDRLLTIDRGRGPQTHDPDSCKQVVVRANNGIVIIGYSGLAYLGEVPTDMWIASRILGRDDLAGRKFFMSASGRWIPHIYPMAVQLVDEINAALAKERPRGAPFELMFTGFENGKHDRIEPFALDAVRDSVSGKLVIENRMTRPFPWHKSFLAQAVGRYEPGLARIRQAIRDESFPKPDDLVDRLVEEIRTVADSDTTVGKSCNSVRVYIENGLPVIVARHHPAPGTVPEVSYTPWVIGADTVFAPHTVQGGPDGGWSTREFRLLTPSPPCREPGKRRRAAASGQSRPARPRR